MAQLPPNLGSDDRVIETIIRDKDGQPILIITYAVMNLTMPDGSVIEKTLTETIELVDGFQWHAGLLSAKPPVYIGVCEFCRRPPFHLLRLERPTHGLVRLKQLKLCANCGTPCCPRHRIRSSGQWRCPECARTFQQKNTVNTILRSIFFRKEQ